MNYTHQYRFLLWNDLRDKAEAWELLLKKSFSDSDVQVSSAPSPEAVCDLFLRCSPDFVILDIFDLENDRAKGLEIVKLIRQHDRLVPVIAVTEYPNEVYRSGLPIDALGLNAVFSEQVMKIDVFETVAFRPVMDECHRRTPEFCLFRSAGKRLMELSNDPTVGESANKLWQWMQRLPFSGDRDNWHSQLCRWIKTLLDDRGYSDISERFDAIAQLFRDADPFYMAIGIGRRHVAHNVQVFLLGLTIMLNDTELHSFIDVGKVRRVGSRTDKEDLFDAVLLWACAALTHDVAYFQQFRRQIDESLRARDADFERLLGREPAPPDKLPERAPMHHSHVGSDMWLAAKMKNPRSVFAAKLIAAAVRRHDPGKVAASQVPVYRWMEFLAVLCDQLQDWAREKHEDEPGPATRVVTGPGRTETRLPYDFVSIEHLFVGHDRHASTISIVFTSRYHHSLILSSVGMPGSDEMNDRLKEIGRTLGQQLRRQGPFEIALLFLPNGERKLKEPMRFELLSYETNS